jgi:hypothetical protein
MALAGTERQAYVWEATRVREGAHRKMAFTAESTDVCVAFLEDMVGRSRDGELRDLRATARTVLVGRGRADLQSLSQAYARLCAMREPHVDVGWPLP